MWCLFGGAVTHHPDANLTSIPKGFRKAQCEMAWARGPTVDPSFDAGIAQKVCVVVLVCTGIRTIP